MPTLAEIANRFGGHIRGDDTVRIERVASLFSAGPRDIAFYDAPRRRRILERTKAGAIVLAPHREEHTDIPRWIPTGPPRLAFARLAASLHPRGRPRPEIRPGAVVSPEAVMGQKIFIGEGAVVSAGASIGDDCIVGPRVFIGENATIGARTELRTGVVVGENCRVGIGCLFHPNAVIGADGFGFVRDGARNVKIPQIGAVEIGDEVEIGANACVDRGALDNTTIGDGVKIDNLVQIGHNVRIGRDTVLCGCAGVAGSATIGERCLIGGGALIAGHITLGDEVSVAGGSTVTRGVRAGGVVSSTMNAVPILKWKALVRRFLRMADDEHFSVDEMERPSRRGGRESRPATLPIPTTPPTPSTPPPSADSDNGDERNSQ